MPVPLLSVAPVTRETWRDLEKLFKARGAPHYCWCTAYRFREPADKRAALFGLVEQHVPVGVLAYDGGESGGCCSPEARNEIARAVFNRPCDFSPSALSWLQRPAVPPRRCRRRG
jgi:hypothetical protein